MAPGATRLTHEGRGRLPQGPRVRGPLPPPWVRLGWQARGWGGGLKAEEHGELMLSVRGSCWVGRKLLPSVSFPVYYELSHAPSFWTG